MKGKDGEARKERIARKAKGQRRKGGEERKNFLIRRLDG